MFSRFVFLILKRDELNLILAALAMCAAGCPANVEERLGNLIEKLSVL